jgi:small subunit ribosomal protein S18
MAETREDHAQQPAPQAGAEAPRPQASAEAPRPQVGAEAPRPQAPAGDRGERPRPRYGGDRGDRGGRDSRDRDGGRRGGFRPRRRKVCAFCVDKITHIDYKEHQRLHSFVSDRGKILKSRQTGTCTKHQRALANAIKRARHIALLPFVAE